MSEEVTFEDIQKAAALMEKSDIGRPYCMHMSPSGARSYHRMIRRHWEPRTRRGTPAKRAAAIQRLKEIDEWLAKSEELGEYVMVLDGQG